MSTNSVTLAGGDIWVKALQITDSVEAEIYFNLLVAYSLGTQASYMSGVSWAKAEDSVKHRIRRLASRSSPGVYARARILYSLDESE